MNVPIALSTIARHIVSTPYVINEGLPTFHLFDTVLSPCQMTCAGSSQASLSCQLSPALEYVPTSIEVSATRETSLFMRSSNDDCSIGFITARQEDAAILQHFTG